MARLSRLLDTNTCIYLIRGSSQDALRRFEDFEVGEVGVSTITVSELRYGAEKSAKPGQNREALDQFLLPLEVAGFGMDATTCYGRVRAALEKRGTPIGPLDTLIASSSGYCLLSQPEICCGDQSSRSFSATTSRKRAFTASRHLFGRRERSQARSSAFVTR